MKPALFAPAVSLILLLIACGAYVALRTVTDEKSIAVLEIDRQITAKAAESARLASVRERLAALGDLEGRIAASFVPDSGVVGFINELQSRGTVLGSTVEITSVATVPGGKSARPALDIELSIKGSFDVVMRTVSSIEYAPYDIRATDTSLFADTDGKTWVANMRLVVGGAVGGAPVTAPTPAFVVEEASTTAASTTPAKAATSTKKRL